MTQQLAKKENVVADVMAYVNKLQAKGDLLFPKNYSPKNALMSAWLILQNVTTKKGDPVLQACTKSSISQSLLEMVTLGLNPAKKQCYFIPYGKILSLQISRYGYEAMAKRADPRIDKVVPQVVWKGDKLKMNIVLGEIEILEHIHDPSNRQKGVDGAYCLLLDKNKNVIRSDYMDFEQIKQAWRMSPMAPVLENGDLKSDSTHRKFIEEMCKKTIVKRICKPVIQSSDDSYLLEQIKQLEQHHQVQQEEENMEQVIEAETASVDFDEQEAETEAEKDVQEQVINNKDEDPGF